MLQPPTLPRLRMGGGFHLLSAQTKECIALSAKRKYGNPTTLGAVKRAETNFDLTTAPIVAQGWTVTGMAEYIELTEELILSMRAGARAISNTKKYHGRIYVSDVFSDNPKEIPYLQASEILYAASEKESEDVAKVRRGRCKKSDGKDKWYTYYYTCVECGANMMVADSDYHDVSPNYCPNCGAKMDGGAD